MVARICVIRGFTAGCSGWLHPQDWHLRVLPYGIPVLIWRHGLQEAGNTTFQPLKAFSQNRHNASSAFKGILGLAPIQGVREVECLWMGRCQGTCRRTCWGETVEAICGQYHPPHHSSCSVYSSYFQLVCKRILKNFSTWLFGQRHWPLFPQTVK